MKLSLAASNIFNYECKLECTERILRVTVTEALLNNYSDEILQGRDTISNVIYILCYCKCMDVVKFSLYVSFPRSFYISFHRFIFYFIAISIFVLTVLAKKNVHYIYFNTFFLGKKFCIFFCNVVNDKNKRLIH